MADERPLSSILGTEAIDLCMAVRNREDAKTVKEAITPDIHSLQQDVNQLRADFVLLQQIHAAHIITSTAFNGCVFDTSDGFVPNWSSLAVSQDRLISVDTPDITEITNGYTFYNLSQLRILSLPNLTTISGDSCINGCAALTSISLPNLTTISGESCLSSLANIEEIELPELIDAGASGTFIASNANLKRVILPKLTTWSFPSTSNSFIANNPELRELDITNLSLNNSQQGGYFLNGDIRLIKLCIGANFNGSKRINGWNPTEALRTDTSSLVEEGETFANNREKLLYNIRTYIAANLPDMTGQSALTLTVHSAIKAAINADPATAAAFTDKHWTIA